MTHYVDTHCHLDLFDNVKTQVLFEDNLPIKTITVTNAPSFFRPNISLFENAKNIRVALGLHPELALQFRNQLSDFSQQLDNSKYVGEIGLDGSTRFKDSFIIQKNVFENILIEISKSEGKVLTIHSRNAANETINLLKRYKTNLNNKVILHWYSGDKSSLRLGIEMGFYFSVNHKMLQSAKGIEIARNIPDHLLLTETDAPFTFNELINTRIASLKSTCQHLSATLKIGNDEVVHLIYQNFKDLLR